MKKFIKLFIIIGAFLTISENALANATVDYNFQQFSTILKTGYEHAEEIYGDAIVLAYKDFVSTEIPAQFVEPFVAFTKDDITVGLELLAIGWHESNWSIFKSNRNRNGSYDLGPLMLNSYNIKNKRFMNEFASDCGYYEYDTDTYYMVIAINYFRSLRLRFSFEESMKIYNGGFRTLKTNCPPNLKRAVNRYVNSVMKYKTPIRTKWYDSMTSQFATIESNLFSKKMTQIYEETQSLAVNYLEHTRGNDIDKLTMNNVSPLFYRREELIYKIDEEFINAIIGKVNPLNHYTNTHGGDNI
ncbi:MAG: hypothetical protein ACRC5M_04690 [Anaeroplasmataceae bacterium]